MSAYEQMRDAMIAPNSVGEMAARLKAMQKDIEQTVQVAREAKTVATRGGWTAVQDQHPIAVMIKQDGPWFWNPFFW